jgi:hypothetical protein
VSKAHWQVALQALGQSYTAQTPDFQVAALQDWNASLGRAWHGDLFHVIDVVRPLVTQKVDDLVQQEPLLLGWRDLTLDFAAAPGFSSNAANQVTVHLPNPPSAWKLGLTVQVGHVVTTNVLGFPLSTTIQGDVAVEVRDIRIVAPVEFDLSDPRRPEPVNVSTPQIDMRLSLTSTLPILHQLLPQVTTTLDPIIRVALLLGAQQVQQQAVGALQGLPQTSLGTGGPGTQAVSAPATLLQVAEQVSDDIMRDHTPYGTIAEVTFDQPGYGNGAHVRYSLGDSTIWTGHYLMGEALRYDLTGDQRALAAADKVMAGLRDCLDVSPIDGRLSRNVVPDGPFIHSIQGGLDFAWYTLRGQRVGTMNDISRDQYVGVFMGMSQTWLRVPALRDRAKTDVGRMVSYLDGQSWVAKRADGVTPARARYAFTPGQVWAVIKAGYLTDPQRFANLHDPNTDLSSIFWFTAWSSSHDPISSYYKHNLGHDQMMIWFSTETAPALYRDYAKNMEIARWTTGHHLNAWFDGVYAAAIPAVAPVWGPVSESNLKAWTLRDRREHPVDLRNDPTIQTVMFTPQLVGQSNPQSALQNGGLQAIQIAKHPIPVEKRRYSDFMWQRDPFNLVGGGSPTHQNPGVDLVQPYWLGRSYGLFR